MTKPRAPVCGARTRAGTLCQNTLVTGCGRCPVHASQLRAAAAGVAPTRSRVRKKKKKEPLVTSINPAHTDLLATPPAHHAASAAAAATAAAAAAAAHAPAFAPFANDFPADAFATPVQPPHPHHHHSLHDDPTDDLGLDAVLRKDRSAPLGSPVTPNTPDNAQQRFEYVYPGEGVVKDDDMHAVDVLTGEEDVYLDPQLKVNFDELCGDL